MIVKDIMVNDRPRERLVNYGCSVMSNEELLAVIIGSGTNNMSVKELALNVLNKFDKINDLKIVSYDELIKIKGIGCAKACQILACIELGKRIYSKYENIKEIKVTSALEIYEYYKYLCVKKQEHFFCVYLDNKNKIISEKLLYIGTINESLIHPRDIFKEAYLNSAVSFICVHNHPSGEVTPSSNDIQFTNMLIETSNYLGIRLLDHIIIGNGYYSFAEDGKF